MKELTDKQIEILNIIRDFINEYGYSPTVREIGNLANLSSSATVHFHLSNLKKNGYITFIKGKMRTIRIIEG